MAWYEIYNQNGLWVIWKWYVNNSGCERVKSYKTRKGAESWAAKQWARVIWR